MRLNLKLSQFKKLIKKTYFSYDITYGQSLLLSFLSFLTKTIAWFWILLKKLESHSHALFSTISFFFFVFIALFFN